MSWAREQPAHQSTRSRRRAPGPRWDREEGRGEPTTENGQQQQDAHDHGQPQPRRRALPLVLGNFQRIEMKMMLSIPSTISRMVR